MRNSKTNPSRSLVGKEPWLAVTLSMLFPGIGQIYSGNVLRGWIFILSLILTSWLGVWLAINPRGNTEIGLIVLLFTIILIPLWNLLDAYNCTKKANTKSFEQLRKSSKDPWLAAFLSSIIPGVGHLYIGKITIGILLIIIFVLSLNVSLFLTVVSSFSAYHAYTVSPVRREKNRRIITIIAILLVIIYKLFLPLYFIKNYTLQFFWIPAESMRPTLQVNDHIVVDKWIYKFQSPQRGDIVVFSPTDEIKKENPNLKDVFIKRVIGLPGDNVQIKDEQVYINDRPLQENYIAEPAKYQFAPVTIPPNSYLVLGDDRNNSYDSHY